MMSHLIHRATYGLFGTAKTPDGRPPVAIVERGIAEHLNPGAPFFNGEEATPVPRWPEHGAAMVAATPEDLLETQSELLTKLKESSPLSPGKFDEIIKPALVRYASWVHLLPASEQHHHFGPGGLLRHGIEVAVHASRMADGKQIGMDLVPSERTVYSPRWRIAAMFGGLLHDIGKPLVDCGATDPDRTITWPAQAGPLSEWLREHALTHYRIYWRSGARHERHKAIGTSVAREILGKDVLRYLSEEPTREVVDLMMLSIAQGRTSSNLMSQIVSKADSMSVEEDLRHLAKRTQASAQGGSVSNCSRIISELRDLVESGKMAINRPGEPLWWTSEGLFGIYPRIIEDVLPKLVAKQIPGIPASKAEIAQILVETGFLMLAEADTHDGKQTSSTWDLHVTIESKGEAIATHKMRTVRFVEPGLVVGSRPLPPPYKAEAKPPFVNINAIEKNMEAVRVVGSDPETIDDPPSTETHTPTPERAGPIAPMEPRGAREKQAPFVPSIEVTGSAGSTRNKRDAADATSIERAISRGKKGIPEELTLDALMERLRGAATEGMALGEVFERIMDDRYTFNDEYTDTLDGLAVHYPGAFEGLGVLASDLMQAFAAKGWLVIESGSDRKINERNFGDIRRKCLIFQHAPGKVWDAIKRENPGVLSERKRAKADPAPELVENRQPSPTPQSPEPQPARTPMASAPESHRASAQEEVGGKVRGGPLASIGHAKGPGGHPQGAWPNRAPDVSAKQDNILAAQDIADSDLVDMQSLAAKEITDLNPKKINAIKAAARMVLERDLFTQSATIEEATTEQIRDVLVAFADRNAIGHRPLCRAILQSIPVLTAEVPVNYDFSLIREMRVNPNYKLRPKEQEQLMALMERLKIEKQEGKAP